MSSRTVIVEPRPGASIKVGKGAVLTVEDLDGGQVADLVCFALDDHAERFSQARTRVRNWTTRLGVGSALASNRGRPMFTILEDAVGVHDVLLCPCHSWVYEHVYGVGPRDGCFENLSRAAAPYGIAPDDVPDPFNVFMNTSVDGSGALVIGPSPSAKGDRVALRAETDCLRVFVLEEHRRAGAGTSLFRRWEAQMRERGASILMTSFTSGEEESRTWHRRNGFERSGRLTFGRHDPAPEDFLVKDL